MLQHHGTATRMLDVTTDPMIALWFACQGTEHDGTQGILFAVEVSSARNLDWRENCPIADIERKAGSSFNVR